MEILPAVKCMVSRIVIRKYATNETKDPVEIAKVDGKHPSDTLDCLVNVGSKRAIHVSGAWDAILLSENPSSADYVADKQRNPIPSSPMLLCIRFKNTSRKGPGGRV